ncbi:MAG: spore germination protein, partial [Oscillospiraceae bacterium]
METALTNSLEENKEKLKKMFAPSVDFYAKDITICGFRACICILEGLSSIEKMWIMTLDALNQDAYRPKSAQDLYKYIMRKTTIPVANNIVTTCEEVLKHLTSGASLILIDGFNKAIVISTQGLSYRSVSEASGEGNLKGGKEGFIELLRINISLIRRLIRSKLLCVETIFLGKTTQTEVAIFYHKDLVPKELLKQVKDRLAKIDLQMIFDTGTISPFLEKDPLSLFSASGFTERPDTAAAKICEGKIVIMVNGSPFALVVPTFFCEHFQTMDDYAQRPYFASFIRLLKYTSFLIAILLPGVFVAIANFTPELFPPQLLYKIAASEKATPMPLFLEAIFVNFLLEIVREA